MPRPYGGRVGRVDMRWATRVGHGRRVDTRGAVTLELYGDETGRSGVGAVGTAGAGASGGGFAVRSHGGLFAVRTGLRSPGGRCGGASDLRLAVVVLAPLGLLAQGPPGAASPCDHTAAYSPCELVFDLPANDAAAHHDLYAGVELRIEFRSPHQHTYAMPGYWDGGRRMVVRFSPVEAGEWNYRVASNIAAWNGQEGSFTAAASKAPGFVRPAEVHHWAYTERNLAHLWMGA